MVGGGVPQTSATIGGSAAPASSVSLPFTPLASSDRAVEVSTTQTAASTTQTAAQGVLMEVSSSGLEVCDAFKEIAEADSSQVEVVVESSSSENESSDVESSEFSGSEYSTGSVYYSSTTDDSAVGLSEDSVGFSSGKGRFYGYSSAPYCAAGRGMVDKASAPRWCAPAPTCACVPKVDPFLLGQFHHPPATLHVMAAHSAPAVMQWGSPGDSYKGATPLAIVVVQKEDSAAVEGEPTPPVISLQSGEGITTLPVIIQGEFPAAAEATPPVAIQSGEGIAVEGEATPPVAIQGEYSAVASKATPPVVSQSGEGFATEGVVSQATPDTATVGTGNGENHPPAPETPQASEPITGEAPHQGNKSPTARGGPPTRAASHAGETTTWYETVRGKGFL